MLADKTEHRMKESADMKYSTMLVVVDLLESAIENCKEQAEMFPEHSDDLAISLKEYQDALYDLHDLQS